MNILKVSISDLKGKKWFEGIDGLYWFYYTDRPGILWLIIIRDRRTYDPSIIFQDGEVAWHGKEDRWWRFNDAEIEGMRLIEATEGDKLIFREFLDKVRMSEGINL